MSAPRRARRVPRGTVRRKLPLIGWRDLGTLSSATTFTLMPAPHDALTMVDCPTFGHRMLCRCGWRSRWCVSTDDAWTAYARHYERMSAEGKT